MDDFIPFGSRTYGMLFVMLLFARGMDFLSTWVATPNLVLEGNPLAKKLGWKWGVPLNLTMCFLFAFWMLPAVVISTTSLMVAARNFQGAWLMRSMGEENYRAWHLERIEHTRPTLFLFCLLAQTSLTGAVGVALVYFSGWNHSVVVPGIGLGIIAYAGAVLFYSLLAVWRLRRNRRLEQHLKQQNAQFTALAIKSGKLAPFSPREDVQPSGN